jgi:hypothetical protein
MTTLQNYDQYFRIVPNRITEKTKGELLELAYEKDAFVDISYKISFFKHPAKLQKYAPYGVAQMLRVTEEGSKIHKDKNRYNEFDGIYMPRNTIINYPLTDNPAGTNWYDEEKNLLTTTEYNGHAVILNAGGYYHNVDFKRGDKPRIVFQLCFEESLEEVWNLWNTKIYDIQL